MSSVGRRRGSVLMGGRWTVAPDLADDVAKARGEGGLMINGGRLGEGGDDEKLYSRFDG